MKPYVITLSFLLFLSFSLEAQSTKKGNKKARKRTHQVVDHKSDDLKLRKGTSKVVDHKSDDLKMRRGTSKVVDHKSDDLKIRKGGKGNAFRARSGNPNQQQKLRRGKASAGKGKNRAGKRNRPAGKRKRGNN